MMPQDYSLNSATISTGSATDMSRVTMTAAGIVSPSHAAVTATPTGYQVSFLILI